MSSKKTILPYLALGIGVLSLGFSAMFVRWANAPAPVMGFYRLGLATLILAPAFFYRSRRFAGVTPTTLRTLLIWPFLAGVASAFDHFTWNTSLNYTSAANATLLGNTAPFWVALAAWLIFRERLKGRFWVGLAITMGGAATVLGSDFLRHPTLGWGDLLALGAGIFYAIFYLFSQRSRQKLDTLSHVWLTSLSSALVLLAMSLLTRSALTGYPLQTYLAFLGAALLPQVAGYLAIGYAIGHLPASTVAPTMVGQPVLTALLAIPLLGEPLSFTQVLGGVAVLVGIYLINRVRGDKEPLETVDR